MMMHDQHAPSLEEFDYFPGEGVDTYEERLLAFAASNQNARDKLRMLYRSFAYQLYRKSRTELQDRSVSAC